MTASGIKLLDATCGWRTHSAITSTIQRRFSQSSMPALPRWTDAYLAAFAKAHTAQLVTFDRGFTLFSGVDFAVLA